MERSIHRLGRRSFLGALAAAGAGAAVLSAAGYGRRAEAQTTTPAVTDVLNFALNLEFLEANFYIAASGATALPPSVTGASAGLVTGLPTTLPGILDPQTLATAKALAQDETNHINQLISAIQTLGGTPISQPAIDFSLGGTISITTEAQFLAAARQFTAVGNGAYGGAAQYLVSQPAVLQAAAQILGAEAQHLGGLNYLCDLNGVISPAVDALDVPPTPPNTFFTVTSPTTASGPALGPVRTTSQVLGIVYGVSNATTTTPPAGVTSGGFFPNGVNGNIVST